MTASPNDISISVAARTEPGPCRNHNEDAFQVIDLARGTSSSPPAARGRLVGPAFVLGVYDGCGHGRAGTAGDLAAAEIHAEACRWPLPLTLEDSARRLADAVIAANRALFAVATEHPYGAGMGTTLTVTALGGDGLALAHVGDTRAYLLRDGDLVQLTRDHTLIEEIRSLRELSPDKVDSLSQSWRALRDISPEQLADLPRNVITRALGTTDALVVDLARVALYRGDRLALCTDGLSSLVDPSAITAALRAHAEPDEACNALVDAAVRAGGYDNITVLVVDVDGERLPVR